MFFRKFRLKALVCFLFLTVTFQNCSKVNFSSLLNESLTLQGNGGSYGGKLVGTFYRYLPGFTCESKETAKSFIEVTDASIRLTESTPQKCQASTRDLDRKEIDQSIYQSDLIGYQEGIFDGFQANDGSVPTDLVEVWCRDRNDELGIETITHYDRTTQKSVNRIYYSKQLADGTYEGHLIPDFSVSRVIISETVFRNSSRGFELRVHRDQPAPQLGLFKAHLEAEIEGQKVTRETYCRLGGALDPAVQPLVPNLIQLPKGANSTARLTVGGLGYFVAKDLAHGTELWRTDGTPGGTFMLMDINPGPASSSPDHLVEVGGVLYFTATTSNEGTELWRTDGSPTGTRLVKDIVVGPSDSSPEQMIAFGTKLAFVVTNSSNHNLKELWLSDGTSAGTYYAYPLALYDAAIDPNASGDGGLENGNFLTVMDGYLWFYAAITANNFGRYFALLKSDGTNAGTSVVLNGMDTVHGGHFLIANPSTHRLFFDHDDMFTQQEVWISDGTPAGTSVTLNLPPSPTSLMAFPEFKTKVFANGLVFSKYERYPQGYPCMLYFTSGTGAATVLLKPNFCASGFVQMGSFLYFTGVDYFANHGTELWRTDGTAAGTTEVMDINPGLGNGINGELTLAANAGLLYFRGNDGVSGEELWVSDGTPTGTRRVRDLNPGPGSTAIGEIFELGTDVYLSLRTGSQGAQLWKTKGTAASTVPVQNFTGVATDFWPNNLFAVGPQLVFSAYNPTTREPTLYSTISPGPLHDSVTLSTRNAGWKAVNLNSEIYLVGQPGEKGADLYRTAGTTESTFKVTNIFPTTGCSDLALSVGVVNGHIVFDLNTSEAGREYWTADGSSSGVNILKDTTPGPASGLSTYFGFSLFDIGNGKSIFKAGGPSGTLLPWITDGTSAGTMLWQDLNPAVANLQTQQFKKMGNKIFFTGAVPNSATGLWLTDENLTTPVLLKQVYPFLGNGVANRASLLLTYNNRIYFRASTDGSTTELWSSDGTTAGTQVVMPGLDVISAIVYKDKIFMCAKNSSANFGWELYSTDGTPQGTSLVKDINSGTADSLPNGFRILNNRLLFQATAVNTGSEPWSSDGTTDGTYLLKDFIPGISGSSISAAFINDSTLYFLISVGTTTQQLWKTDGTPGGTTLLNDIAAESDGPVSGIQFIDYLAGYIYFVSSKGDLWALDPTALAAKKVPAPANLMFLIQDANRLYFSDSNGNLYATP
jgi:trimeric autotransporter adhesin